MSQSAQHHAINYIEFTTSDIALTKSFYEKAFSWSFQDWGPDYISFDVEHAGIAGGFRKGEPDQSQADSAPLEATEKAVELAGGKVTVPTFEFPGGRRFHFSDGQGNVLAVWSK